MQMAPSTLTFERQPSAGGLGDDDIAVIVSLLAGDLIAGIGGARKVRFARAGASKSGGYRTIHYFVGDEVPILLLALVDKRERTNVSKAERNKLATILPKIAAAYREGRKRQASSEMRWSGSAQEALAIAGHGGPGARRLADRAGRGGDPQAIRPLVGELSQEILPVARDRAGLGTGAPSARRARPQFPARHRLRAGDRRTRRCASRIVTRRLGFDF